MIGIYLVCLVIAPQLWVPGLIGLPVDFIIFPVWFIALSLRGRAHLLLKFELAEKLFAAFFVWIVLSAAVNGLTDSSKDHIYIYLRIFVLYKAVSASVVTTDEVKRVLTFFVFLAAILAVEAIDHKTSPDLLGWAGQKLGWVDPSVLKAGGTGRVRWVGIFDGPGVFCVVFTIALGICLPYLGKGNRFVIRLLALAMVILLSIATYLTGSRGGLLATLAIIGLFVAVIGKISLCKIAIGALLCVVAFMLAPPWMTSVRDENKSAQYRVEMWAEGLEMMKHDPILGIGRGNFRSYTSKLIAHNSAIEIGGETGIVGLTLWCTLLYISFKAPLFLWREPASISDSNVGFGLTLALIGYIVSAMFVTLEYETLYFLLALCAALSRQRPTARIIEKHEILWIFTGIGAFLVFLQIFVVAYLV